MPSPALIAARTTELIRRDIAVLAAFIGDSHEEADEAQILLSPSPSGDFEELIAFQLLMAATGNARGPAEDAEESQSGGLPAEGWQALAAGDFTAAMTVGDQLIERARAVSENDWNNFGSLLHEGHILRGYALLRQNDVEGATAELGAAGKTPGSPTLNSFGPDITLAWELLQRGQDEPVIRYFHAVSRFWSPIGTLQQLEMHIERTRPGVDPEG